jgi:hypothetical protein
MYVYNYIYKYLLYKGCVLIALWGVPTATFHDNCRRALGASARIRSKLLEMKMKCSCGITTGMNICIYICMYIYIYEYIFMKKKKSEGSIHTWIDI